MMNTRQPPIPRGLSQRGAIMIMTLIAMVILLITGVALVRSFDSSVIMAGNVSFKRDFTNRSDQGIAAAIAALSDSSVLGSDTLLASNEYANNYSATKLDSNNQGIPKVLISDSLFTSMGMNSAKDITPSGSGMTIRYVIDRQCSTTGSFSSIKNSYCTFIPSGGLAGSWTNAQPGGLQSSDRAVYRISVRVEGLHGTRTYVQATVSR